MEWCSEKDQIIGPFIFEDNVNGQNYLNFLSQELPALLEEVPLNVRRDMFLQHDGCPAHFSLNVRNYLDTHFPNKWIGRGSIFPWPARSPDLTVLDFYLWGTLKQKVYATRPTTREDMVARIRDATANISRAEIETGVLSTRERLQACIDNEGQHFEHLGRH